MSETHKGLPVAGYREQTQDAVDFVNAMKIAEEIVLRNLDDLATVKAVDQRWLQVGRTQIEQGFMAVNRSIFRPGRVTLPDEVG